MRSRPGDMPKSAARSTSAARCS